MSEQNGLKRRAFLLGAGSLGAAALLPTPVERLLKALSNNIISQAQAGDSDSRNYVNVLLQGAPHRYVFDHWIRTSASDPSLIYNPMVTTKFSSSGGRVVGTEYSTFNYNGVQVPHMFSHNVYKSDGSQRPLTDLLKNMLVIRGYGTGLDGHPFNAQQQQAPVGGVSSIAGCAADYSSKYFEAVQWPNRGAYTAYNSSKGKALNTIGGSTPLATLMEGFQSASNPAARSVRERNQEAFDLAMARIKAYAGSDKYGSASLNTNLENAYAMLKRGVAGVETYWAPAVARYKKVIESSMRQSGLVGISDMAMLSDEGLYWRAALSTGATVTVGRDYDFRNAISTMTVPTYLAEGFALAEYILKEKLGTSVEIWMQEMPNLTFPISGAGNAAHNLINDMHETGAIVGLLVTTAFYRGLSAAILELSTQLGDTNWKNTVLQVISDFARSARSNGSGSDHGFNQMVTSVFSGAIANGPFVVGNIRRSGLNASDYAGTQGVGTSISGYNQNGRPTPVMAASTVAALLNLPHNPFENLAAPTVRLENGQLKVLYPTKLTEE